MFRHQLLRQSRLISQPSSKRIALSKQTSHFSSYSPSQSIRTSPFIQQRTWRRWQSTDAEKNPGEKATEGETKAAEASPEESFKVEIEKKNKEIVDLKDKYLRSVADFRNLQDRSKRDNTSARNFAIQRFAADLLESIDNLDRALGSVPKEALGQAGGDGATTSTTSSADANKAAPSETASPVNQDLLNLYSGLRMTETILMNTLKKHGLERFDPLEGEGRKFDPNMDEATFFTKVEGKNDGDVFFTQSKGYTLNGRVVRAAKVGVVKNT